MTRMYCEDGEGEVYNVLGMIAQGLANSMYARMNANDLHVGDLVAVEGNGKVVAVGPVTEVNYASGMVKVLDRSSKGLSVTGDVKAYPPGYGSELMQEYGPSYTFVLISRAKDGEIRFDTFGMLGGQRVGDPTSLKQPSTMKVGATDSSETPVHAGV